MSNLEAINIFSIPVLPESNGQIPTERNESISLLEVELRTRRAPSSKWWVKTPKWCVGFQQDVGSHLDRCHVEVMEENKSVASELCWRIWLWFLPRAHCRGSRPWDSIRQHGGGNAKSRSLQWRPLKEGSQEKDCWAKGVISLRSCKYVV